MTGKTPKNSDGSGPRTADGGREDRLKAALRANLARRKAQARARGAEAGDAAGAAATGPDEGGQG